MHPYDEQMKRIYNYHHKIKWMGVECHNFTAIHFFMMHFFEILYQIIDQHKSIFPLLISQRHMININFCEKRPR